MAQALYIHLSNDADTILRTSDNTIVSPLATDPTRVAYDAWVAQGNVADAFVPHVGTAADIAIRQLVANDGMMFRALELLIDVLLAKGVIAASDFSPTVRNLYSARKALRNTAGLP